MESKLNTRQTELSTEQALELYGTIVLYIKYDNCTTLVTSKEQLLEALENNHSIIIKY